MESACNSWNFPAENSKKLVVKKFSLRGSQWHNVRKNFSLWPLQNLFNFNLTMNDEFITGNVHVSTAVIRFSFILSLPFYACTFYILCWLVSMSRSMCVSFEDFWDLIAMKLLTSSILFRSIIKSWVLSYMKASLPSVNIL